MQRFLVSLLFLVLSFFTTSSPGKAGTPPGGFLHIRGSDTAGYVVLRIAEAYMAQNPEVRILVTGGGTWRGYKSMLDNTADIGMFSAPIPDDLLAIFEKSNKSFTTWPLAFDAVVPIVNLKNPVSNLSIENLRDIYSGKITNWKQVGGPDAAIEVFSRESHKGTFELWRDTVLTVSRALSPTAKQVGVAEMLTQVSQNVKAIGYSSFASLTSIVKPLKVEGVLADRESLIKGKYPLWRKIGLIVKNEPTKLEKHFLDFLLSKEQGMKIAQELNWNLVAEPGKPEEIK